MSSEIVVLNKSGIAVAADSAVTIGNHLAVYNSANKLFSLSSRFPLGVLAYSVGSFMGVPLDVVFGQFKHFLETLHSEGCPSLSGYCDLFLNFLASQKDEFHYLDEEYEFVGNYCAALSKKIKTAFEKASKELSKTLYKTKPDPKDLKSLQDQVLSRILAGLKSSPKIKGLSIAKALQDKYCKQLTSIIDVDFSGLSVSDRKRIMKAIFDSFDRKFSSDDYAGVAFFGYGEKDVFPSCCTLRLYGFAQSRLFYSFDSPQNIDCHVTAGIIPLAQTDVIETFLRGFNNQFVSIVSSQLDKSLHDALDPYGQTDKEKKDIEKKVEKEKDEVIGKIFRTARKQFTNPLLESIQFQSPGDLARLAESMITITSLRRFSSLGDDAKTVGGPVDVAVVTKSDGFVWIKHKKIQDSSL